ncbi:MAG: diphthine synthase [Candidatus Aenigmarchaeota archaeon]|nr:diphthine synthase [Candidatus Aenigmarchaeota archaeon]
MLYLIGLGLRNKDITLNGLKAAKKCKKLYVELYTSPWEGLEELKALTGKEIIELKRDDLEENLHELLEEAKSKDIGILIPGDPLVATTHTEIVIEAKKVGIETKVVHAPSIYSVISETGLFIYKFGKTTTIPFPQENFLPESPYETIKENKSMGLHTLCLLDIRDRAMTPKEGLKYLLEIERKRKENVISEDEKIVVFSIKEKTYIKYDKIKNIMVEKFPTPAVLIFPGKLHFKEKEYLEII